MLSIIDLNKENKEFDTPVEDYNIRPPSYGTAMKKGILQRFTRLGRMTGYLDSYRASGPCFLSDVSTGSTAATELLALELQLQSIKLVLYSISADTFFKVRSA